MYRILCYGDSNTWGYNPANGLRFSEKERWPGVLSEDLGPGFEIIEEGLNGRRILDGADDLISAIRLDGPLDVIIIYLGINDICFERDVRIEDLVNGIRAMLSETKAVFSELGEPAPEIIFIGTVPVNEEQVKDCLYELEAEKAKRFSEALRKYAGNLGCGYIDSGKLIESSRLDGVHLEACEHRKLGLFVANYVRTFLTNTNLGNLR